MTKKKKYFVSKTYHCDITGEVCGDANIPYNSIPPDCDNCEIATTPEPPDISERYETVLIVPGKGVFRDNVSYEKYVKDLEKMQNETR